LINSFGFIETPQRNNLEKQNYQKKKIGEFDEREEIKEKKGELKITKNNQFLIYNP